jgi:hypothetical protein
MTAASTISAELTGQANSHNLTETAGAIFALINQGTSPHDLDQHAKLIWRAYGDGSVNEAEASFLSTWIESRRPPKRALERRLTGMLHLGARATRISSRFAPRQRQRSLIGSCLEIGAVCSVAQARSPMT